MKHYKEISKTDASKVVAYRAGELHTELAILQSNIGRLTMPSMPGQRQTNWGDVGTLSNILEQIENLNDSFM